MIEHDQNRRRSLSEIARGRVNDLRLTWNQAQATGYEPLPPGKYNCLVARSELTTSRTHGTPGYKICFEVLDRDHRGQLVWHDVWLTAEAMGRAKYELGQIGITDLEQLERPLPPGLIAEVVVSRRTGDDGLVYNKVRGIKAIPPSTPVNDFAPPEAGVEVLPNSPPAGATNT